MLYQTQFASQFSNPFVIKALTMTHGVYVNVYDKKEGDAYDEGRDNYISNPNNFCYIPRYNKIKLLLYPPVKESYESGKDSFDTYIEDIYILTCDKTLVFNKKQKFEIFYDKFAKEPQRIFQCFEVKELSNAYNLWSIKKVMLEPFN